MSYTKKQIKVPSCDKKHILKGYIYIPDGQPKAVLHIVHGMAEHIGRYDELMAFFAEKGYLVAGYDHLGHGKTVLSDEELGYIAKKNGYKYLIEDVHIFGEKLRKQNKGIPYYLFGHSMGSFIVRLAANKYPDEIDRLIICGTGGPNPLAPAGLLLADIMILLKGRKGFSNLVNNAAFGSYNKGFDEDTRYAWLTKDTDFLKERESDKLCNYSFTVSAMHDLVKLNRLCNLKKWFKNYRKDLPTLIISGDKDPVGDRGNGVKKVYDSLIKYGAENITFKLYENCRHEIHNDTSKDEVYADMLDFLE